MWNWDRGVNRTCFSQSRTWMFLLHLMLAIKPKFAGVGVKSKISPANVYSSLPRLPQPRKTGGSYNHQSQTSLDLNVAPAFSFHCCSACSVKPCSVCSKPNYWCVCLLPLFPPSKFMYLGLGDLTELIQVCENARPLPCLVWLSRVSTGLWTKGLLVRFPVRAHAWGAGQVPSRGHRETTTHCFFSLSLSPSLPLSLKINKYNLLKKC